MDSDELYTLRNAFFLGNYAETLAEADTIPRPKSEVLRLEKDVLVARAHIALGNTRAALEAMGSADASSAAAAVRALAAFSAAAPDSAARKAALATADGLVVDADAALAGAANAPATAAAPLVLALCGSMYFASGLYEQALRAARSAASLELLAIAVQTYLRLDRADLAEVALASLAERDDESALYQLSAAHTYVALGAEKAKEAVLIFRDVLERYGEGAGPAAQNGLVAALIAAKRLPEAEAQLQEAASKDALYPETLANMAALAALQNKPDVSAKALATLKKVAPNHPLLQARATAEAAFDRVASTFD